MNATDEKDTHEEFIKEILDQLPELKKVHKKVVKQHMVPKFYLRNFSKEPKKTIKGIYSGKLHNPAIRTVCYREYAYGEDSLIESALGILETSASRIIGTIIDDPFNVCIQDIDYCQLLEFMGSLHARSVRVFDNNLIFYNGIASKTLELNGITDYTAKLPIEDEPCSLSMDIVSKNLTRFLSLKFRIIANKSAVKFVTSDCPVCVYNPVTLDSEYCDRYGLFSSGNMIMLPICPDVMLFWYDPLYYSIRDLNRTISIKSDYTINEINKLLIANSYEWVFFDVGQSDRTMKNMVWKKRNPELTGDKMFKSVGELMVIDSFFIRIKVNLNFITPIKKNVGFNATYGSVENRQNNH